MSKKSKELGLAVYDTHMGLFDFTVRVAIGDHDNTLKYIAHVFDDEYEEMPDGFRGYEARGITYFKRGYVPIVWIPKYPETPREYATFAHEVIHAVSVAHVIANTLEKLKPRQQDTGTDLPKRSPKAKKKAS